MDSYIVAITLVGLAALGMAWMPSITQKTNISYSVFYVLLGILAYWMIPSLPDPIPKHNLGHALRLSEMMVLVSLMGTGLKIDQSFSLKTWNLPFRLILITMILSIGLVTALGMFAFSMSLSSALLLGAALAPTDPVLASDVQVGPPLERQKDQTRFTLTAEAGMNDGMAFPFIYLALVVMHASETGTDPNWLRWFSYDFLYRIATGVGVGFLIGKFLAWVVFDLPERKMFLKTRDGFVAISATLLVYGITELIHGYGFIAVFVTAVTIRNYELHNKFHRRLHSFTDQIERILLGIVLILFGGALGRGILDHLTLQLALFGIAFVFLIRPICAYLALIKTTLHIKEKLAISFFGIRGIGSIFYLAFAFESYFFSDQDVLWSLVSFVVLVSIVLHGCTAVFTMKKVGQEFSEEVDFDLKE